MHRNGHTHTQRDMHVEFNRCRPLNVGMVMTAALNGNGREHLCSTAEWAVKRTEVTEILSKGNETSIKVKAAVTRWQGVIEKK